MIGNDIVDLVQAAKESNWQRRGYLNKIFTADEQSVILSGEDPTMMVWHLWSCKEAVYKIIHRHTRIRTYAPLKFNCSVSSGTVTYNGKLYPFKSRQTGNCIHTIAAENEQLLNRLEIHTGNTDIRQQWNIIKDEDGIPFLNNKPVSVSHHGCYAGLVILNHLTTNHLITNNPTTHNFATNTLITTANNNINNDIITHKNNLHL
jgi:phosphopantetheinyl transferase (holo-ACP synthase)